MKILFVVKEKLRLSRLIQSERVRVLNTNKLIENTAGILNIQVRHHLFKAKELKH